ncbi:hypothetical protein [Streptomyces sp. NBC_01483]|uniref:hypothetical protein n=1 Tax=Streptomyces sp. NBC_01483 TaxID=2903883 RepID=UPI002E329AD4|nr:hypothetical protein [Streptomyces sp. NBC_01483]
MLFEVVGDVMAPMEREPGTGITAELVCGACRRWRALHQDTIHTDKEHLSGPLLGTTSYDWAGRGGTAVWRAERQVCVQYFWDWLVGRTALGDGGGWSVGGVGGEARLMTAGTARAPGGRVRWIGALIDAVRCALSGRDLGRYSLVAAGFAV